MNRASMSPMYLLFGGLFIAMLSTPARGQSHGEVSVPEPTRLHAAALADGSELLWSEPIGVITSTDAHATVSVIEVESRQGVRIRGMKIMLKNSTSTDLIYVTEGRLPNFRDEIEHLEFSRRFYGKCEAKRLCIHGIARCRPSQTERQAYCPGRYSTPDSEEGLHLTTPRHSFMFLSVGMEQLVSLIGVAIQTLE